MAITRFPNDLQEVGGWANTEIMINGKIYSGIKSFKGPNQETEVENIFGQGVDPVGYGFGNSTPLEGSINIIEDSYNELLIDVAGDNYQDTDLRDYPLNITETINPDDSSKYDKKIIEHTNVRVKSVEIPERSSGTTSYEVSISIQFTSKPMVTIIPKS